MGHIYKPTYTREIPAGAQRCTVKGRPAARWQGRRGVVRVGIVCADNPARCRVECDVYHVVYTDAEGVEQDVPAYSDRAASDALLVKLTTQAARIASGLIPPESARERLTMGELLDRWRDHLTAAGRTEKHARTQRLRAAKIVTAARAERPADLTPAAVVRALAAVKSEEKLSGKTASHHMGAVKAFTRWLAHTLRYEPTDPLSGLSRSDDDTDPRRRRRVLPPDEFDRLIAAARQSGETRFGLTGFERAVLYLTAASTGLRAAELASLTPASFDLARKTVTVQAAYAKGRRTDELPLPDALIPQLKQLLAGKRPTERVWPPRKGLKWDHWHHCAAEMARADLEAAGIPVADESGKVYDFHSLRGQYITDLQNAGASLARTQRLARHSTPLLTAKYYTHATREDLAADVNRLRRG